MDYLFGKLLENSRRPCCSSRSHSRGKTYISHYIETLDAINAPVLVSSNTIEGTFKKLDTTLEKGTLFEHIMAKNLLPVGINTNATVKTILDLISSKLATNGTVVLCETLLQEASKISDFYSYWSPQRCPSSCRK